MKRHKKAKMPISIEDWYFGNEFGIFDKKVKGIFREALEASFESEPPSITIYGNNWKGLPQSKAGDLSLDLGPFASETQGAPEWRINIADLVEDELDYLESWWDEGGTESLSALSALFRRLADRINARIELLSKRGRPKSSEPTFLDLLDAQSGDVDQREHERYLRWRDKRIYHQVMDGKAIQDHRTITLTVPYWVGNKIDAAGKGQEVALNDLEAALLKLGALTDDNSRHIQAFKDRRT